MDKEKQIEEMKLIIDKAEEEYSEIWNKWFYDYKENGKIDNEFLYFAKVLYNAGYRKASEVAREMFDDFQSILFSIMYFGNDGKYHLRKMSADKVTLIFEKYFELKKKYTEVGG